MIGLNNELHHAVVREIGGERCSVTAVWGHERKWAHLSATPLDVPSHCMDQLGRGLKDFAAPGSGSVSGEPIGKDQELREA
jgi:hypothetical protein